MYLNVNVASNASATDGSCSTPRTPEILNLLAGGPFENAPTKFNSSAGSRVQMNPRAPAASTPGEAPCSPREHASFSPGSSLSSPATPGTPSGSCGQPSIQNARTYLIKEGLKLTIQSKRLASGRTPTLDGDPTLANQQKPKEEVFSLTPEDEERRRRRRERNKLAATKCRNRKKERTGILLQESGTLEDQNVVMRSEIQKLEAEKRRLMDVLSSHSPACVKAGAAGSSTTLSSSSYAGETSASHYALYPTVIPRRGTVSPQQQGYDFSSLNTGTCSPTGSGLSNPVCSNAYDCRPPSVTQMSTHPQSYDVSQCMTYSSDLYSVNQAQQMTFEGSQSYR